jgi:hypothetical protein
MTIVHADLQNKHYIDWMHFLRASENWSKAQIEEYELHQIRKMVKYAHDNTTGYRRLYIESMGSDLFIAIELFWG